MSRMCRLLLLSVLLTYSVAVSLQPAQYVDYREGTLNLIISAPHGGMTSPSTIKDRTAGCFDATSRTCRYRHDCTPNKTKCGVVTERDMNTFEAAEKVRQYVFDLTGKYPYFIANKLRRIKLDPNRAVNEATFGESVAVDNYEYYHGLIESSRDAIASTNRYDSSLLIDLHGQAHTHELTELGYRLTSQELDTGSYSLQATSSVRYLANKFHNSNQTIIGRNVSLGFFLDQHSLPCMPSPSNPTINGRKYFDGGYTVDVHSSSQYDAIQIELARSVRVTSADQFDLNMQNLAAAVVEFLSLHYPERKSHQ